MFPDMTYYYLSRFFIYMQNRLEQNLDLILCFHLQHVAQY